MFKNKAQITSLNAANKRSVQELKAVNNSYGAIKTRLVQVTDAIDKVDFSTKEGARSVKRLREEQAKLNNSLKQGEAQGSSFKRNVGNYANGIRDATGAMIPFNTALLTSPIGLIAGAFAALVLVGKQAFNFFKEYEVIMSKVKATTGATREEFDLLRDSTIEFGESTKFTAREVGQLQLELAKLGFTTDEIIDSTEAILDLAVATDSELGEAAKITASTLNQFNLEAKESKRVTDVMAKAFSSSALDIEKFSEGMKNAGPAAQSVGATVEETTAILAKLADANIDSSTSGSALRNIFIDLADKGISWSDAMTKIQNSQVKVVAANELFGKRGAIVAKVIAENTEEIDLLTESFRKRRRSSGGNG